MERSIGNYAVKCKSLVATYGLCRGALSGPRQCSISLINDGVNYEVNIKQALNREISVSADQYVDASTLFSIQSSVEKLLMLFEGRFIPLKKFSLSDSESSDDITLKSLAEEMASDRLIYYDSADFCKHAWMKLLDFDEALSMCKFRKWERLLGQMDIAYQIYLYALSRGLSTSDLKLAFLAELAEPFAEIIKIRTAKFNALKPGNGSSLPDCIEEVIKEYGQDVFQKELSNGIREFAKLMKDNRVRIMHIKYKQTTGKLPPEDNIRYVMKFALLYRRILLELMGINYSIYRSKLLEASSLIDNL